MAISDSRFASFATSPGILGVASSGPASQYFGARWAGPALLLCTFACAHGAAEQPPQPTANDLILKLELIAEQSRDLPVQGADSWLYLPSELRSLRSSHKLSGTERFDPSAERPLDPVLGILEFRDELLSRGIELLLVPVPAKVAIYPEFLGAAFSVGSTRLDQRTVEVLDSLRSRGVATVDLLPAFQEAKRRDAPDPLFVPGDSHWSSRGCMIAASEVEKAIRSRWPDLFAPVAHEVGEGVRTVPHELEGDLRRLLPGSPETKKEQLLLHGVVDPALDDSRPDPVALLLGDSHLLVWRQRRAGFADHLELLTGRPLDVIAVQAGGPTASRQALARRIQALESKRLVIWVFASRSLAVGPPWRRVAIDASGAADTDRHLP